MNKAIVKGNKGRFVKRDGSNRTMRFVRIKDLPEGFLDVKIGSGKSPIGRLPPGMELVWDIDKGDFRYFNNRKKVGRIVVFDYALMW